MLKNFITKIKFLVSDDYAVYKACSKMPLESNEYDLMRALTERDPEDYQDHIKENPFMLQA